MRELLHDPEHICSDSSAYLRPHPILHSASDGRFRVLWECSHRVLVDVFEADSAERMTALLSHYLPAQTVRGLMSRCERAA